MVEVAEAPLVATRDKAAQRPLAAAERLATEVLTVQFEEIEGVEHWPLAPEQQRVEVAGAIRPKAHDLAVEHGVAGPHGVGEFPFEIGPLLENVAAAGHEAALVPVHDGQGPEAVVLQLEHPV